GVQQRIVAPYPFLDRESEPAADAQHPGDFAEEFFQCANVDQHIGRNHKIKARWADTAQPSVHLTEMQFVVDAAQTGLHEHLFRQIDTNQVTLLSRQRKATSS